jgi:hypothetical protein
MLFSLKKPSRLWYNQSANLVPRMRGYLTHRRAKMAKCPKCEREVSFVFEPTETDLVFMVKCPECNTAISAILDISGKLEDFHRRLDDIERHVDPVRL